MSQTLTPDEVRAALRHALARKDAGPEESPFERAFGWLFESIDPSTRGTLVEVFTWVVALTLVVALVRVLVRVAWAWYRPGGVGPDLSASRELDVRRRIAELMARGAALNDAGDLRGALRSFVHALVLGLGESGELEFHDAWTYRELLARGAPSPSARGVLNALVGELEAKEFGRVPVAAEDVSRVRALCERHLGAAA